MPRRSYQYSGCRKKKRLCPVLEVNLANVLRDRFMTTNIYRATMCFLSDVNLTRRTHYH